LIIVPAKFDHWWRFVLLVGNAHWENLNAGAEPSIRERRLPT